MGEVGRKAYSAGGLSLETCLGGGEAGGSNGDDGGGLHDGLDWLIDWFREVVGLYRVLGVLIRAHA